LLILRTKMTRNKRIESMSKNPVDAILLVGKESAGKSLLAANLTGCAPVSANFRGSTVACETYSDGTHLLVDAPGILLTSDSQTTQIALERLQQHEKVLLVVKCTRLDEDLTDLLPLLSGKKGAVVVTYWDKVREDADKLASLSWVQAELGVPVTAVDARKLSLNQRKRIFEMLEEEAVFSKTMLAWRAGWKIEPAPSLLDLPALGVLLALLLLLLPAGVAVWAANSFAGLVEPRVIAWLEPLVSLTQNLPTLIREMISGQYGLLTMGPLMFVWAVPTVVLYALLLGAYKASGLAERITVALHPVVRPIGLTGRDVLRVMMGFGCNVPAVISTRSCSACTRGSTIAAIAFGSACSYQFGATLAVFAAAGHPSLIWPYLLVLMGSTLLYTRLTTTPSVRSSIQRLAIEPRNFLELPSLRSIWREMRLTIGQFFGTALPVFLGITLIASFLNGIGLLDLVSGVLTPFMGIFRLPPEAALPVVLASIRKDGLLLLAQPELASSLTQLQLLTGVYLGGVLLPCLVTALTIAREQSVGFALRLMARQATAAVVFTLIVAWGGLLFVR
jgi:Fe2+ transport system protein B